MIVIQHGKEFSIVVCPYCEAILGVTPSDRKPPVSTQSPDDWSITCPECQVEIPTPAPVYKAK